MTNLSCAVLTPIKLLSWGHLVQLSHLLSKPRNADWGLFKADHEAAYKQPPIGPGDQRNAIVALRHPQSRKWFGFITRTLIFGAVAAVLHYNVLSRAWTALINRALGIQLICFCDDFASAIQLILGEKALAIFSRFCELLDSHLKPGKSSVGNKIVFRGLLGAFPARENRFHLSISPAGEKRGKLACPTVLLHQGGAVVTLLSGKAVRAPGLLTDPGVRKICPYSAETPSTRSFTGVFTTPACHIWSWTTCRGGSQSLRILPHGWLVFAQLARTG